jgi:LytS/YehU family sensor histidine kinase
LRMSPLSCRPTSCPLSSSTRLLIKINQGRFYDKCKIVEKIASRCRQKHLPQICG